MRETPTTTSPDDTASSSPTRSWRDSVWVDRAKYVGRWMVTSGLIYILGLAILVGGVWVFAAISDEVFEGETATFDEAAILAMRTADPSDPIGPHWVEEMGRDFTALGGMAVLTLIALAVAGFLALKRKYKHILLLVASIGGGIVFSLILKNLFSRPRPDLVPHDSFVYTTSFPSGHAMLSAVTYLTLAALLANIETRRRLKLYLVGVAVFLTVAVGVSRVYVGVHWPTDVLAGWTAGASWAVLIGLIAHWLQRRGAVEQAGEEPEAEPERQPTDRSLSSSWQVLEGE